MLHIQQFSQDDAAILKAGFKGGFTDALIIKTDERPELIALGVPDTLVSNLVRVIRIDQIGGLNIG